MFYQIFHRKRYHARVYSVLDDLFTEARFSSPSKAMVFLVDHLHHKNHGHTCSRGIILNAGLQPEDSRVSGLFVHKPAIARNDRSPEDCDAYRIHFYSWQDDVIHTLHTEEYPEKAALLAQMEEKNALYATVSCHPEGIGVSPQQFRVCQVHINPKLGRGLLKMGK